MIIPRSKNVLMTAAFGAAAAIATMLSSPAAALESLPDPFESAYLNWFAPETNGHPKPVSIFVANDGENYTHVNEDAQLTAKFGVGAKVKDNHRIYGYAVVTGDPSGPTVQGPNKPLPYRKGAFRALYEGTRKLADLVTFKMDAATALNWGTYGIEGDRAQKAVDDCNTLYPGVVSAGNPQPLVETVPIHVHLAVAAGKKAGASGELATDGWWTSNSSGRPAIRHRTIYAAIYCTVKVAQSVPAPKVLNVDIRVKQKGDTCPKDSEVTAYIDYDRPTTARFWIVRNGQRDKTFSIKAREVSLGGKTWYRVERMQPYKLGPGKNRFHIEVQGGRKSKTELVAVTCPPFKVFSTWLKYEVAKTPYCPKQVKETVTFKATRPGFIPYRIKLQGGAVAHEGVTFAKRTDDEYVAKVTRSLTMNEFDKDMIAEVKNDPAANSGWTRLKVDCLDVAGATLTLRDQNGPSCTRSETAAIAIRTDLEGPVPYRLDCTGGRSFTGTAVAHKTGSGTFIGVDTRKLAISKTEQINCALKTTINGKTKIVALRGHSYQCVKRNVGSASDDVSSVPDPTHDRPKPTVVVDPVPNFTCVNGRKVGGKCKCRRDHRLVRIGSRHYRCDIEKPDVVITPPTRIPDPAVVSCNNGRKIRGKCKCRRGDRLVRIGSRHYRCDKQRPFANGGEKTGHDAAADRRRLEALKKAQEAKKRAAAERRRKAAKKAAEARRKREAAKKAAAAKRKAAAKRRSAISSVQKKAKRLR